MRFPRTTRAGYAIDLKFPWRTDKAEIMPVRNTPWNGAAVPSSAKQAKTINTAEMSKAFDEFVRVIILNELACDVRSFKD